MIHIEAPLTGASVLPFVPALLAFSAHPSRATSPTRWHAAPPALPAAPAGLSATMARERPSARKVAGSHGQPPQGEHPRQRQTGQDLGAQTVTLTKRPAGVPGVEAEHDHPIDRQGVENEAVALAVLVRPGRADRRPVAAPLALDFVFLNQEGIEEVGGGLGFLGSRITAGFTVGQ